MSHAAFRTQRLETKMAHAMHSDLEKVKRIVLRGLEGTPARVYLYGSFARGQAVRTSDIDVAVLPEQPLGPGVLAMIREALEESTVPYPVEVTDLSEAPLSFREQVLREGIPWND